MAWTGLSIDDVRDYQSPADPDPKSPTTFKLRALTGRMQGIAREGTIRLVSSPDSPGGQATELSLYRQNRALVRFGMIGWSNFLDRHGVEIEFKKTTVKIGGQSYDVPTEETLDRIPLPLMLELASVVNDMSSVSQEEAKSSEDGGAGEGAAQGTAVH